jgi:LmbE family N-acetylglucosaminyl deacetylase
MTATIGQHSLLVLAPHPDDETLGCGMTILRCRAANQPVTVVVATNGSDYPESRLSATALAALRREEMERCSAILGNPSVVYLDHEDGRAAECVADLADEIFELASGLSPDLILSTSACDPHPDHRALGVAARYAAARIQVPLLEYPVWQWLEPEAWLSWGKARHLAGHWTRPRLVSIKDQRDLKWSALSCHASQLPRLGNGPASKFLSHFFGSNEYFFPVRGIDQLTARSTENSLDAMH